MVTSGQESQNLRFWDSSSPEKQNTPAGWPKLNSRAFVSAPEENTVSTPYLQELSENKNKLSETEPVDSWAASGLGEPALSCLVHLPVGITLQGYCLKV